MFFFLYALWLLLNGQWTTEIAVTGLVISVLLYLFICKFMDYSPKRDWEFFRRIPRLTAYIIYLIGEIFKSSWQTILLIWSPKLIVEPEITSFRTKLKTGWGKVILANSITLTPGTITVDVHDDLMLVHCIDKSYGEGLEDSDMEHRVAHVEEGGRIDV